MRMTRFLLWGGLALIIMGISSCGLSILGSVGIAFSGGGGSGPGFSDPNYVKDSVRGVVFFAELGTVSLIVGVSVLTTGMILKAFGR